MMQLAHLIILCGLNLLDAMVLNGVPLFSLPYSLIFIIPSVTAAIRRLHDVNYSGWWLLVPIFPLILACQAGTRGSNRFGHDPKR